MRLRHQYEDRYWFDILWMTIHYVNGERQPVSPTSFHRPSRFRLDLASQIFEVMGRTSSKQIYVVGSKELAVKNCPEGPIEEIVEDSRGDEDDDPQKQDEGDELDDPVSCIFEPRDIPDVGSV
jgi:hypothetical protein